MTLFLTKKLNPLFQEMGFNFISLSHLSCCLLVTLSSLLLPITALAEKTSPLIDSLILQSKETDNLDSAVFILQRARNIAEANEIQDKQSEIDSQLGWCYNERQQYQVAIPYLENALKILEEVPNDTVQLETLNTLTNSFLRLHQTETAMSIAADGLELAKTTANQYYEMIFLHWFACVLEIEQQWERASSYAQESLNIAKILEDPYWNYFANLKLAIISMKKGDSKLGLTYLESCKQIPSWLIGYRDKIATVWLWEGVMQGMLKKYEIAADLLLQAIPVFDSLQNPNRQMHVRLELGRVLLEQDRYNRCIEVVEEVVKMYPEYRTLYEDQFANDLLLWANKGLNNYEQALFYSERIREVKAELDSINNQSTISELEAKYQKNEQNRVIEQQRLTLELQKKAKSGFIISLVFLVLLLFGTFYVINYLNRTRKKLADQNTLIASQAEELKKLDQLKDDFLANVSHEIRTPLTVILGISKLQHSYIQNQEVIRHNARRLLNMVNQLLDFSKLDAGSLKINQERIEVIVLLRLSVNAFQSLAVEKNIQLQFESDHNRLIGKTDADKLEQIVNNLLSNAIKFTSAGGTVTLSVTYEKQLLTIQVKDTGIGIAPESLDKIFERFHQAGKPVMGERGTGIGLALIKEMIELMQGEITVESELGVGSTFTVTLPILPVQSTESDRSEISNLPLQPIIGTDIPINKGNGSEAANLPELLIIEDDPSLAHYLETLLAKNYNLRVATDGVQGINSAIEFIPDIIISDVQMPGKDGFEVVETLKNDERTNHIPIILLTARTMQIDRLTGLKYGVDAYLNKPFDQEELFIRLNKLLELRRTLQERYAIPNVSSVSEKSTIQEPILLKNIREYLEQDLSISMSVEELSEKCHLTRTQLYRKVKALTGKSPNQYMNQIRLEHGAHLLKTTDNSISEIAYTIGYTDPKYFARIFNKFYKSSPTDYRKN